MTAKYGLGGLTGRLGEKGCSGGEAKSDGGPKTALQKRFGGGAIEIA
jgi:hypothetical protein